MSDVSVVRNYHPLQPVGRGYAQNDHQHRCKGADNRRYDFDHDHTFVVATDRNRISENRSNLLYRTAV